MFRLPRLIGAIFALAALLFASPPVRKAKAKQDSRPAGDVAEIKAILGELSLPQSEIGRVGVVYEGPRGHNCVSFTRGVVGWRIPVRGISGSRNDFLLIGQGEWVLPDGTTAPAQVWVYCEYRFNTWHLTVRPRVLEEPKRLLQTPIDTLTSGMLFVR